MLKKTASGLLRLRSYRSLKTEALSIIIDKLPLRGEKFFGTPEGEFYLGIECRLQYIEKLTSALEKEFNIESAEHKAIRIEKAFIVMLLQGLINIAIESKLEQTPTVETLRDGVVLLADTAMAALVSRCKANVKAVKK